MNPFDKYTLRTAQAIVDSRVDDQAQINLDYFGGDHWRNSDGWVGPRPTINATTYTATLQAIQEAFVTRNVIRELTGRHVNGVLARELEWGFTVRRPLGKVTKEDPLTKQPIPADETPNEAEQQLIDEAEAALTEWWDNRGIPEIFQYALSAALNTKRAVLRLYVPPGMRNEFGDLPKGELAEVLDYIWLQHLGTNEDTLQLQAPSATVYCDKLSRRDIGLFTYKAAMPVTDGAFNPAAQGADRAEMTYLDDDDKTVLRVIEAAGDIDGSPLVMPLGGRLTIYELTRQWLITPQIISQQKLLNMTMSMKARNAVLGGFLERMFFNVKWPGHYDANGNFIPDQLQTGAGTANSYQGSEYTDEFGKIQVKNPSVVVRDPVSPDTFIATEQSAYLAMLQEGNQLHYALAGETVVSGESRKQARDAFKADLQNSAGKVEAAGRWLLETALAMAAYFSGQPGKFDELRAYVQARVDSGPVSPEDRRTSADLVDRGMISRETGQAEIGVEDVDAETDRINREQAQKQQTDAANMVAVQRELNKVAPPVATNGTNGTGKQPALGGA